jgi:hypothetical protein
MAIIAVALISITIVPETLVPVTFFSDLAAVITAIIIRVTLANALRIHLH